MSNPAIFSVFQWFLDHREQMLIRAVWTGMIRNSINILEKLWPIYIFEIPGIKLQKDKNNDLSYQMSFITKYDFIENKSNL